MNKKILIIYTYDLQQFETIRSFGDSIYTGKVNIEEAERDQRNFVKYCKI